MIFRVFCIGGLDNSTDLSFFLNGKYIYIYGINNEQSAPGGQKDTKS